MGPRYARRNDAAYPPDLAAGRMGGPGSAEWPYAT